MDFKNNNLVTVVRVLYGLLLLVFGLNYFMNFFPVPEMNPNATQLLAAFATSGYILGLNAIVMLIGALSLLLNRFVPLALILLSPLVVHINLFHAFLEPAGAAMGVVMALMTAYLAYVHWYAYEELFYA